MTIHKTAKREEIIMLGRIEFLEDKITNLQTDLAAAREALQNIVSGPMYDGDALQNIARAALQALDRE